MPATVNQENILLINLCKISPKEYSHIMIHTKYLFLMKVLRSALQYVIINYKILSCPFSQGVIRLLHFYSKFWNASSELGSKGYIILPMKVCRFKYTVLGSIPKCQFYLIFKESQVALNLAHWCPELCDIPSRFVISKFGLIIVTT